MSEQRNDSDQVASDTIRLVKTQQPQRFQVEFSGSAPPRVGDLRVPVVTSFFGGAIPDSAPEVDANDCADGN